MNIYLYVQGEQRGPYEKSQIEAMWNAGQITSDTPYWHQGMTDWAAISRLLADTSMPPPPPSSKPKPERVEYEESTNTFRGTMAQVIKLAMRAVQERGWTLVNVNDTLGLVTFETGMTWGSASGVSGSLSVVEVSENQFRVSGTGKQNVRGDQLFALDLGEAQRKVNEVPKRMRELAKRSGDLADAATHTPEYAAPESNPPSPARKAFLFLAIGLLALVLLLLAFFNYKPELRKTTLTMTIYPQDGSSALPAGTTVEVVSHSEATAHIRYSGRDLVVSMEALRESK